MIFETIMESEERGELMCPYFLRYHVRRDKQLTIYEIWIPKEDRGKGKGTELLEQLKQIPDITSIVARCPTDLRANDWYKKHGFQLEEVTTLKSGRQLNTWKLPLN